MARALADEFAAREEDAANRLGASVGEADAMEDVIRIVTGLPRPRHGRGFFDHSPPGAILTAPLFYDQPLVDVCPTEHNADDIKAIRWMAENNLATPVITAHPRKYTKEALALLTAVPTITSPRIMALQQLAMHRAGTGRACGDCISKMLDPRIRLTGDKRRDLVERVSFLPGWAVEPAVGHLNSILVKGGPKSLPLARRALTGAARIGYAQVLGATAQVSGEAGPQALAEFATTALQITYTSDVTREDYLQIIKDRKGALSFLLESHDERALARAIPIVQNLNREIMEIEGSSVARLHRISTAVWSSTRRRAAEAILAAGTAGMVGIGVAGPIGGAVGAACGLSVPFIDALASAHLASKAQTAVDTISAHSADVSREAFQIWSLREALGRNPGSTARQPKTAAADTE